MRKIDIDTILLHAESKSYKKKLQQSIAFINNALKQTDNWYVALSGGKDSTVVFIMVKQKKINITALWSDDEFYLPETKEYIERLKKKGNNILCCSGKAKHIDWFIANKDSQTLGIEATAKEKGLDGVFLGLRAEENKQRKIFLRKYSPLYFVQQKQIWYCNPVAWWSVYDVWAYILSNQIDYNKAYDRLSVIGVSIDKQRIGPFATEGALGYGQLAILKMGWPEEYQRFQEKYPEATAFV